MDDLKPLSFFIEKERNNSASYLSWLPREIVAIIQQMYDDYFDYTQIKTFDELYKYINNSGTIYFLYHHTSYWDSLEIHSYTRNVKLKYFKLKNKKQGKQFCKKITFDCGNKLGLHFTKKNFEEKVLPQLDEIKSFSPLYKIDYDNIEEG